MVRARLKAFNARRPRFKALKRAGVDTAKVLRTEGVAAMTYGAAAQGVSPSMLLQQRRAAAMAVATGGTDGGHDLEVALILADGKKGSR